MLYPVMSSHRDVAPRHRERMGIRENLVRLSVGIEARKISSRTWKRPWLAARWYRGLQPAFAKRRDWFAARQSILPLAVEWPRSGGASPKARAASK